MARTATREPVPQVINRDLYRRLRDAFGPVKVVNFQQEMIYEALVDPFSGRKRLLRRASGETYRVCCPYCGDTRHRLYVGHLYGRKLADDRRGTFLAVCHNENCLADEQTRALFQDRLAALGGALASARLYRPASPAQAPTHFTLPGICVPLGQLPLWHKANRYLAARGYDPLALAARYDLRYCTQCLDPRLRLAVGRLIVPVYRGPSLIGWQGRYVGELDWKREDIPKYFTCPGMDRSSRVLRLEIARRCYSGVLVEGWWDVFPLGDPAMPLLGAALNELQMGQLARAFRGRSLVWLLDPDQFDQPKQRERREQLAAVLARAGAGLVAVKLPCGFDPGGLHGPLLDLYLRQEGWRQGIKVSFLKSGF